LDQNPREAAHRHHCGISDSGLEESLSAFRQARAIEALASLQRRSVEMGNGKMTLDEIDAEIKGIRRKQAR
jgi:hypothetical protein